MKSQIHLLMITYNRFEYTKRSIPILLEDTTEEFDLTIWDNGSTDGTQDYLRTVKDRRIVDIVFSNENRGQTYPTNKIWSETSAELVGKVDNDCLVTPGWTRTLSRAHADLPELGVVGCWHFPPEDFDYNRARHKIQTFGRHQIFRHPWVDGSALLVKRKVYMDYAPCIEDDYLSGFWIKLALAGYVNGFYYPLIYQEHMDDPKSKHCMFKDQNSYNEAKKVTYCPRRHHLDTLDDFMRWRQKVLDNLLDDPWEAKYYVGWHGRIYRLKDRLSNLFS